MKNSAHVIPNKTLTGLSASILCLMAESSHVDLPSYGEKISWDIQRNLCSDVDFWVFLRGQLGISSSEDPHAHAGTQITARNAHHQESVLQNEHPVSCRVSTPCPAELIPAELRLSWQSSSFVQQEDGIQPEGRELPGMFNYSSQARVLTDGSAPSPPPK